MKSFLSALGQTFKKKPHLIMENLVYAIDMGTTSMKIVLVEIKEAKEFNIVDMSVVPYGGSLTAKSFNRDQLRELLSKTFRMIESHYSLDLKSRKALVTLPMSDYTTEVATVRTVITDDVIKYDHKLDLINKARELCKGSMILHTIPLKYYVDQKLTKDPVGMSGSELEMDIMLIGYSEFFYEQIKLLMRDLQVNVGKYVAPPLAFINYYLNMPHPTDSDPMILDLGGETLYCYSIKDDLLVNFFSLPLGGEIMTRDISQVLKIDPVSAKRLKEDFVDFTARKRFAEADENANSTQVAGKTVDLDMLHEIVSSRYEEILDMLERQKAFEPMRYLAKEVILLGSGHPTKVEFLIHRKWGLPVIGLEAVSQDKGYVNAIGLIHYSINNEIYLPQVHVKKDGLKNKLAQVVEDLF